MNATAIVGVGINAVIALAISQEMPGMAIIMGSFCLLSIIGLLVAVAGAKKWGAILVIIGGVAFIPIGVIAMMGARKELDELNQKQFEEERGLS